MKVLFLDIDGVLNGHLRNEELSWNSSNLLISAGQLRSNIDNTTRQFADDAPLGVYEHEILPECLSILKNIIERTDCKIVLSSAWRTLFTLDEMLIIFRCVDPNFPDALIDSTPVSWGTSRGSEIQDWIDENADKSEIENVCIVDDMPKNKFLDHQHKFFVQTQTSFGITEDQAEKIIKILNEETNE